MTEHSITAETRPFALRTALEHGATNPPGASFYHGEDHWKSVALIGFYLSRWTPHADLEFIFTFAMLHDVMRENEDDDPLHGSRASQLFGRMVIHPGLEYFAPYAERTTDMRYTLARHNTQDHARDHDNANVGLCWDADRLTLPRVGKTVDPAYLTTEAALKTPAHVMGQQLASWQLNGTPFPSWDEIAQEIQTWRH